MCLVTGAAGIVGKKVLVDGKMQPGMVRRDMRSLDFHQRFLGESTNRPGKCFMDIKSSSSAVSLALSKSEQARMQRLAQDAERLRHWNPATIHDGELLLVEHWEVARVWREAMRVSESLEAWGQGGNAYGETFGWAAVQEFFAHVRNEKLAHDQYATAPQTPGLVGASDHGHEYACDHCGRGPTVTEMGSIIKLLRCSGCDRVRYCSKQCQKAAWKAGHKQGCSTP